MTSRLTDVEGAPKSNHSSWGLRIGMASDAGVRPDNQDRVSHFQSKLGHICVLADGMGGHRGGSTASSIAIANLPEHIAAVALGTSPEAALVQSIRNLNQAILTRGNGDDEDLRGMGSTVAVLLICDTADGPLAIGAHVGDSRMYFLRGGRIFRLTRDHTLVECLVETGVLRPEDAERHPQAGVLTRALGVDAKLEVDLTPWRLLQTDDVFLLCSDGLSAYVSDDEICRKLLGHDDPEAAAAGLVSLALSAGSKDNISALVCCVAPAI